jgi:hypothetical protein
MTTERKRAYYVVQVKSGKTETLTQRPDDPDLVDYLLRTREGVLFSRHQLPRELLRHDGGIDLMFVPDEGTTRLDQQGLAVYPQQSKRSGRALFATFCDVAIRDADARAMWIELRIARDRALVRYREDRLGRVFANVCFLLGLAWLVSREVASAVRGLAARRTAG